MSKYIGGSCRLCRREQTRLFLKGERCRGAKCAISLNKAIPGTRNKKQIMKSSYNEQLRAKQKVRRYYGIQEKQFRNYFKMASKRSGVTSILLKILLESRLDNVIYSLRLAQSRMAARQIVTHGHIVINNRRVNYPAFIVKQDDIITIKNSKKSITLLKKNREIALNFGPIPNWLIFDEKTFIGKMIRLQTTDELNISNDEQLIVELYSR